MYGSQGNSQLGGNAADWLREPNGKLQGPGSTLLTVSVVN